MIMPATMLVRYVAVCVVCDTESIQEFRVYQGTEAPRPTAWSYGDYSPICSTCLPKVQAAMDEVVRRLREDARRG